MIKPKTRLCPYRAEDLLIASPPSMFSIKLLSGVELHQRRAEKEGDGESEGLGEWFRHLLLGFYIILLLPFGSLYIIQIFY